MTWCAADRDNTFKKRQKRKEKMRILARLASLVKTLCIIRLTIVENLSKEKVQ
jgi:hypothetical protein